MSRQPSQMDLATDGTEILPLSCRFGIWRMVKMVSAETA